jgi:ferric-dicitrate binding protein FerR (iron transport regulator)
VVKTGEVEIRVLGTSFNVDASDQEDSIEVQVETGLVEVGSGDDKVQVRPGETAVFYTKLGKLIKRDVKAITTQFWRNRRLNFKRARLFEVVRALNETYDTTIIISDDKVLDRKITVKFENQDIGEILEVIANTINLKVRQDSSDNFIIEDAEN